MNKNCIRLVKNYQLLLPLYPIQRSINTLPKNEPFKVEFEVDNQNLNSYKHHPGILKLKGERLDEKLENAINLIVSDHQVTALVDETNLLRRFLVNRRVPLETKDIKNILEYLRKEVFTDDNEKIKLSRELRTKLTKAEEKIFKRRIQQMVFKWEPLNYSERISLVYLIEFFSPNYSIMRQIFNELERKCPNFKCESLFDFGSGVGTVMWAANSIWKSRIRTYMNVDMSPHMNSLSQLLIRGGKLDEQPMIQGVNYRQSLPVSSTDKYDIVTSAFSLIELSSYKVRLEVLKILWEKVLPGGFLVLVEYGNSHGFKLIDEARDTILNQSWKKKRDLIEDKESELSNQELVDQIDEELSQNNKIKAHVFSPCPHDMACPLSAINKKCSFRAAYYPVHLKEAKRIEEQLQESYSYVVIKKEKRKKGDKPWPRIVNEDPRRNSAAFHTFLCTRYGNVDHYIATKDRNADMFRLVRYSSKVDQLPIDYRDSKIIKEEQDKEKLNRKKTQQEPDENSSL